MSGYPEVNNSIEACPAPETNTYHSIHITKAENGFIVKIGCKTFIARSWPEVSNGLELYWTDPKEAKKIFCEN